MDWFDLTYAICLSLVLYIVFYVFVFKILDSRIRKIFDKTKTHIDDYFISAVLSSTKKTFLLFISIYISSIVFLSDQTSLLSLLNKAFLIFASYQVLIIFFNFFDRMFAFKSGKTDIKEYSKTAYGNMLKIIKYVSSAIVFIFVLDNLGINITPLVAGLGIGGLTFAFAFQNILKDIFSSFVIALDKPYNVGDLVVFDGKTGKIDKVGLKTTRILGFDGEEIIVPNDTLTNKNIDNFGKTTERRVVFNVSVSYETSTQKLEKIPKEIEKLIEKKDGVKFGRAHLVKLNDSSIDYEIVYYVVGRDYKKYLDKNQEIYLDILSYFESENIEIPYPTRTIYNKND